MIHGDNAVTALAEAVARIGRHEWPTQLPDSTRAFLTQASEALGVEFDPRGPGQHHRQARRDEQDDRRDHAAHRQPDRAQGRLQGQRHPADGDRRARRALPARPRGRVLRRDRPAARHRRSAGSSSTTTSRSRPRPTATCGTRCPPSLQRRRPAARGGALLPVRAGPTRNGSASSASAASGSARCSCRRSWIFPACSTVSTSGCR